MDDNKRHAIQQWPYIGSETKKAEHNKKVHLHAAAAARRIYPKRLPVRP